MAESRFRELERWARLRIQAMIDLTRVPSGGATGQVVTKTATGYDWATPASGSGTGDVVGPASATNNRIATFDGATGKLIKDSGTLISGLAASSHTHASTDVTDFAEAVDDRVAVLAVAGTNMTVTYNDGAGTLTFDAAGGSGLTQPQVMARSMGC